MLVRGSKLIGCPVLSLHVGSKIAAIKQLIIDPDILKIIACQVDGPLVGREVGEILPVDSVREFSRLGMIVDSADEFVEPNDIIRVRDVLKLNFSLTGLKVETKKGNKLGKVIDFTVEPESWQVQQLIVQRPFVKSLFDPELTIARSQVVEVTDYKVIVKDGEAKVKAPATTTFSPNFINPFREPDFATDTSHSKKRD